MARKTKAEARETYYAILEAAIDAFSEKGYSHTTFDDIAQRIGMTKGAVYWHFKDKPALVAALIETLNTRENLLLSQRVPEIASLDDLERSLVERVRVATKDGVCRKLAFFMSEQMEWSVETVGTVNSERARFGRQPFDEVGRVLESARSRGELPRGVDIAVARDMLVAMYLGLLTTHFQGISTQDAVVTAEVAFRILMNGIKVQTPGIAPAE